MEKLSNPKVTIEIIQKYNFAFQKRFGQNFLIDGHVIEKIIRAAEITKDDVVLEIGPGIGTMTQYLAEAAGEVFAVEIDKNLLPILAETLAEYDNVTVVNEDILKVDIAALTGGRPVKVVANLPYYITTPIIMGLFENHIPATSITVMVQKEVADRLAATPGNKIYGTPSVKLAWYGTAERVGTIGRNVFWPAPNVDSALVKFTRYQADDPAAPGTANSTDDGTQRELVFRLIDAAFGQRRKTLHAALKTIAPSEAFSIAGIDPTRRGETLTIAEFTALAKAIESCGDGDEAQ